MLDKVRLSSDPGLCFSLPVVFDGGGGTGARGGIEGTKDGGNLSGRSILLRRSTTKCMAVLNSSNDRAPSFVTSASCL